MKEIEVDGHRIVPIEKLFDMLARNKKPDYHDYYYNVVPNYIECSHPSTAETLKIILYDVFQNPAWMIIEMYKFHFDLNGLIERGLAVDINKI